MPRPGPVAAEQRAAGVAPRSVIELFGNPSVPSVGAARLRPG
ncbi:hypothetical protein [Streptomyces sp. NPDC059604]